MNPAFTIKDVDDLATEMISPEGAGAMTSCLAKMGVRPYVKSNYKKACREGWAPAPTNEFKKVIYEKVKAEQSKEPTKGIKIEYDPKKGR